MRNIEFQNIELIQKLFGYHNPHLEKISSAFNITINSRGNMISLAGEDNDLVEKINPYLPPLYDALYDMLDFEKARAYIEQEIIEIAPIAFMRGRTLNNAFIILDEAQNTTAEQMKMFLTRLGYGSKPIVTFTKEDVVRHPLVSNIIDAYEKN